MINSLPHDYDGEVTDFTLHTRYEVAAPARGAV